VRFTSMPTRSHTDSRTDATRSKLDLCIKKTTLQNTKM